MSRSVTLSGMDSQTHVLVVFASAAGSTKEIANFLGAELARAGAQVDVFAAEVAPDPAAYDVVVVGSAIHDRAWLPPAVQYVTAHREALIACETWLFSVGLGPSLRGPLGRRIGRAVPNDIAAISTALRPRGYRSFSGVYRRAGTHPGGRLLYRMMGGGKYGDLRDWDALREWAVEIARSSLGRARGPRAQHR